MKKPNNDFIKLFSTTLTVFLIAIIVLEYFVASIFISDITDEMEMKRKQEFKTAWDKYFEMVEFNHFTKVIGYSSWNLPGKALLRGDKETAVKLFSESGELNDEFDLFMLVDDKNNLVYGEHATITSLNNPKSFDATRNLKLEELLFQFSIEKYHESYFKYFTEDQENFNADKFIEEILMWHSVENYNDSLMLLTATPIFSEEGYPLMNGFYLFGESMNKILKQAREIISADIQITKDLPDDVYIFSEINTHNSEYKLYVVITPNIHIADIARGAINLLIIIQIILATVAFAIIYPAFTRRYTKNLRKTITERTNALTSSLAMINAALEATHEGIIVIDNNLNTTKCNNKFKEMFNVPPELHFEIGNQKLIEFLRTQLSEEQTFKKKIDNLKLDPFCEDTVLVELNNHNYYELYSHPQIVFGKTEGWVLSFRDVTKEIEHEEEIKKYIEDLQEHEMLLEESSFELNQMNLSLQESSRELELLNASKDKFFSIIAHDLKSPFNGLIGYTEMLSAEYDDFTSGEIKTMMKDINKISKNTFTLLQNLLDWSRIQTGRMELNLKPVNLSTITKEVHSLLKLNAAQKEIKIITDVKENLTVEADEEMLKTVIRNLVSNSLKFTNKGGEVTIEAIEKDDRIKITISDNGVGMNENVLQKLFKIDEHHTEQGTNHEKGTGLGLILCQEMIQKHNSEIRVESEVGKGTLFYFELNKI